MLKDIGRTRFSIPLALGVLTLATSALLLIWNVVPRFFPARSHDVLGALPLGLIALAYFVHQAQRRPGWRELLKTLLLAAAFIFWAMNQLWPDAPRALLYNDTAIALFVLDVFFAIAGWPAATSA
jgi:hypothetical protein